MNAMLARALAGLLVLVLVGPSVVTATCELTCALGRHHHGTASPSEASCHGHESSPQGVSLAAGSSAVCHESHDLPSAVVDAWLNAVVLSAVPAATIVITPPLPTRTILRAHERSTPFDPRPPHRPLRV